MSDGYKLYVILCTIKQQLELTATMKSTTNSNIKDRWYLYLIQSVTMTSGLGYSLMKILQSVGVKCYRCCLSKTLLHNTDSINFSYEYDCIKHKSSDYPSENHVLL